MGDKAAVFIRVSDDKSSAENQVPGVAKFVDHHGFEVTRKYQLDDDGAWKDGGSAEYRATIMLALDEAWQGEFKYLVVWALDRLTRGGAEDALRLIRQFRERGVTVVSVQEPWLSTNPEIQDVLVSFAGWVAQQESQRRSDRIKAGIARRPTQRCIREHPRPDGPPDTEGRDAQAPRIYHRTAGHRRHRHRGAAGPGPRGLRHPPGLVRSE